VQQSVKEQRAIRSILDRACTDLIFREQLLVDPRTAIFETFGVWIPSTFCIKFVERAPGVDALIVLPDVASHAGQVGDAALEAVAGGVAGPAEWADGFGDDRDGSA
jgi:hypothetical protein